MIREIVFRLLTGAQGSLRHGDGGLGRGRPPLESVHVDYPLRRRGDAVQGPRGPEGDELVPDVSPMTNALGWSFAIICGCWAAMQLIEVVAALRQQPRPEHLDAGPPLEEAHRRPRRASLSPRHRPHGGAPAWREAARVVYQPSLKRPQRPAFPDSSMVEQPAVNRLVVGSSPTREPLLQGGPWRCLRPPSPPAMRGLAPRT